MTRITTNPIGLQPTAKEKNVAGQERKKNIPNFEEKKLFQHFAILIKIRSTHLLPICYTSDPKKKEIKLWS
jgi:hypothetical protein